MSYKEYLCMRTHQGILIEKGLGDLTGVHLGTDEDNAHLTMRNGQEALPKFAGELLVKGSISQPQPQE